MRLALNFTWECWGRMDCHSGFALTFARLAQARRVRMKLITSQIRGLSRAWDGRRKLAPVDRNQVLERVSLPFA